MSGFLEDLSLLHTFLLTAPVEVLEELARVKTIGFYMWQYILRPADTEPVWIFDLLPSPDVHPNIKIDKERLILLPIDPTAIVRHALEVSGQALGVLQLYGEVTEVSIRGRDRLVPPLHGYAFGVCREHEAAVELLHKALLKVRGKHGLD